ncbi:MAG TPA: hypothetical protein PLT76_05525 [Candidatus Omnitrophota bacterium]|nr:hypothetical protein [Candidatus Omnitrophota bacterium]HPB68262.1 hypothetical protein [Candidatus Omnitrophota bacterium]HQO58163.1 hypothetical protein [Candidatus Omnitrophota bacterium]
MKNVFWVLLAVMIVAACGLKAFAATPTSSQEFKIAVYIPAIPGVNAPLNQMTDETSNDMKTGVSFYTITEKLQENGQTVIRETIVAR